MRFARSHFLRILVLLLVPAALPAQVIDIHDWNNVKNIARGSSVWVKAAHGKCTGALLSADEEEIRLEKTKRSLFGRGSGVCTFTRNEVREVRFAKRALSALAGAAIGVGAGVGIGLGVEAQYPNREEDGHLLAGVLGFLGGLVGEAVGQRAAFVHGAKIYVAP